MGIPREDPIVRRKQVFVLRDDWRFCECCADRQQ
jgi:hypothetical protein